MLLLLVSHVPGLWKLKFRAYTSCPVHVCCLVSNTSLVLTASTPTIISRLLWLEGFVHGGITVATVVFSSLVICEFQFPSGHWIGWISRC
jgi:hypothetical protein